MFPPMGLELGQDKCAAQHFRHDEKAGEVIKYLYYLRFLLCLSVGRGRVVNSPTQFFFSVSNLGYRSLVIPLAKLIYLVNTTFKLNI